MPTREEMFPSKFLKCEDLKGKPRVVQIEAAPAETLKSNKGEEQSKIVLYFVGAKKALPLNLTNFDAVAEVAGDDDTESWPGVRIELYPSTTMLGGKTVDCIRIRKPQKELPITAPDDELPEELDDSIPW